MRHDMGALALFLVLAGAGLAGYGVLVRVGVPDGVAWAVGRVVGLVLAVFPAWWLGSLGLAQWRWVGAACLLVGTVGGAATILQRRSRWRELVVPEAVFWVGAAVVLFIRLPNPAILQTEKLMDLGIAATLLRAPAFPPPDMWLAGFTLPYYYWGALVWTVPLKVSGVGLAVGYNLVVAALGGLAAATAWALAAELAKSSRAGLVGAALAVFAGTPDGLRQLLAGEPLAHLDLWASSRQVQGAITEFPLFTLWLGDLHPHLLAIPLALTTLLVALVAGRRGPRPGAVVLVAVMLGVTWAANPWALPPTAAGVALLLVCADGRWRWPWVVGGRRWLWAAGVVIGAWVVTAPFQVAFHPPLHGLGMVHSATRLSQLLLWAGGLLLPLAALGVGWLLRGVTAGGREMATALAVGAVTMVAAVASGRPVLVLVGVAVAVLASEATRPGDLADRPAIAVAALGVFLLLVPEVLYVRDPYGGELYRMNTVFKAYLQAWLLLAVTAPVLLVRLPRRWLRRAMVVAMAVLAAPHLLATVAGSATAGSWGLDGLSWMTAGDRAAVVVLERQPQGTVLVEAVGDAYSEHARLSAASGVPAYLGWANHERVWRGESVGAELERRRLLVDELYTCGDPTRVARLMREEGINLVAVGALERTDYPEDGVDAVLEAGDRVLDGGTVLVRVPGEGGR